MSIPLIVNNVTYRYPQPGDQNWGTVATQWAQAVTQGMLQKAGGSFPLTANVDFGGNYGLVSVHFTSRSSNVAQTGALRLASSDQINFRNNANSADLPLTIDAGNQLTFNGSILLTSSYSGIVNANVAANAAIALSKLASTTASRALVSDGSGVISPSVVTAAELGYVSGVTSGVQAQLNSKLSLSGGTMTGPLVLAADPTTSFQAATKQYVDNAVLGLQPKAAAVAATTGPGTLATSFENGDTLDGIVLSTGDRILIKDQVDSKENGIYIVAASGAPSRALDMNDWAETIQAYVLVTQGNVNGSTGWFSTTSPGGTINVDPIVFIQFSASTTYSTDGEGLELTGTVFSLELDGGTLSKSAAGLRLSSSVVSDIASKITNPMTTNGDLITQAAGVPARLPVGSASQILRVVAGAPAWSDQNVNPAVQSVSGSVTLTSADTNKYLFVSTAAARNIQLPAPAAGLNFYIKDSTGQASTNPITLVRNGSEQIEGVAASKVLQTNWGAWHVMSDGTNWFLV